MTGFGDGRMRTGGSDRRIYFMSQPTGHCRAMVSRYGGQNRVVLKWHFTAVAMELSEKITAQ